MITSSSIIPSYQTSNFSSSFAHATSNITSPTTTNSSVTPSTRGAITSPSTYTSLSSGKPNITGAIVGGVLGGIGAVVLVIVVLLWLQRQRNSANPSEPERMGLLDNSNSSRTPSMISARSVDTPNATSSRPTEVAATPPTPDTAPPRRPSLPAYSMPSSVEERLSGPELDLVRNLIAQNVPGPTIAAIVDSMVH